LTIKTVDIFTASCNKVISGRMKRSPAKCSISCGVHARLEPVNAMLPLEVIEVMAKHGWNAVGVYEMVAEQRREHRKWKLPVLVSELEAERQGQDEQ
jgi:hypothetical protein